MHHTSLARVAVATALCLALAACGDDDDGGGDVAGGASGAASSGKVGVILPDAATSPRWEANDRPLLKAAFDKAGVKKIVASFVVAAAQADDVPF